MIREAEPAAGTNTAAQQAADIRAALDTALTQAGYRYRFAPVSIVERLEATLQDLVGQGLLAESFYAEYAESLRFVASPEVPDARTLMVVAYASPTVKVRFELDTGPLEAVIPPTYISSDRHERCLETLRSVLAPAGYSVAGARLPKKLLAVRSGLAQYGRNNLAYVKGLGSKVRLEVFCTDADLQAEEYKNKGSDLMSSCPPCRNCHHHCPTGCIPHAGTVIDATRCLTQLNESPGEWPEWLDAGVHHCLVGCLRCQDLCPANRYYPKKQALVAEFDRQETEIILENLPPEQLPDALRAKLAGLDLEEYSPVLGRNLLALRDASLPRRQAAE
jgi:epoxyqueuosine reductase